MRVACSFNDLTLAVLFALFFPIHSAISQVHHVPTPVIQSNIKVGDHYYDGGISGLSDYMDVLRVKDPKIYQKLEEPFSSLKTRDTWSKVVFWGGIGAGTAVATISLLNTDYTNRSYTGLIVGASILAVSIPVSMIINPSRQDYLDFINRHNNYNQNNRIEFRFGFDPVQNTTHGTLGFRL